MTTSEPRNRYDAVVIGAGFSGLYMLHELHRRGLRTCVVEKADNVGGTWLFNRYPGARCDIESIESYLQFVADRLDPRRDIRLQTHVVTMTFDEDADEWLLETEWGETYVAPFAAEGYTGFKLD